MTTYFVEKPKGFDVKMRIAHAVTRPLRDMTVADICREAGVSRQTFYAHFESKYDIASWCALYYGSLTLREIGRTLSWREGYERWFSMIEQERELFRNSSRQDYVRQNRREVARKRLEEFRETVAVYRKREMTDDLEFFAWMCARLEGTVSTEWFESDFAMPAETMARRMTMCVPSELYRLLS